MAKFQVQGTITGASPMLQSNPKHHHPSDPIHKLMKPVLSKRMKSEEDHEAIAKLSFLTSGHWTNEDPEGVEIDNNGTVHFDGFSDPYIPADCLRAAFGEASKALNNRKGSAFDRGVQIHDDAPLLFEGPKDCNGLWNGGFYRNDRGSRMGGTMVWITRIAIPRGWQADFNLFVDTTQVELETLREMVIAAGSYIGVGSWRPANGGRFGRFCLDRWEAEEVRI